MKCPKCGSTNISTERRPNGFNTCLKCGYRWQDGVKQPDPTTAEMLLWLVENVKGVCIFECDFGHLGIRLDLPRNKFKIFTTNDEVKNRDMLIDKAYKWARKERV